MHTKYVSRNSNTIERWEPIQIVSSKSMISFFGKFLQCVHETNWKFLIFFCFLSIDSKKFSKIKKLCQSFDNTKLAQKKPTLVLNPTLVMNKPLVT
jgi:hypothetical protein